MLRLKKDALPDATKEPDSQQSSSVSPKKNSVPKLKGGCRCQCCPYGYHIDLDFVRYCESLYSNAYFCKLYNLRRHKKHRKSFEAMFLQFKQQKHYSRSPSPQSPVPPRAPPPDLLASSDGLRDAVLDFEETWNLSHTELQPFQATNSLDLLNHVPTMQDSFQSFPSRSSSMSSLSSESSTDSLPEIKFEEVSPKVSEQMAQTLQDLNSSEKVIGIDRDMLKKIRDQVAMSLGKMKTLEEQVKSIPLLQVKHSVLKEEKRLLTLHLKAKNCRRFLSLEDLRPENIETSSPKVPSPDLRKKKKCLETVVDLIEREEKGIQCSVSTNESCTGSPPQANRSIGVNSDLPVPLCPNCSNKKSTSSSLTNTDNKWIQELKRCNRCEKQNLKQFRSMGVGTFSEQKFYLNKGSNTSPTKKNTCENGTMTHIIMRDIVTVQEIEAQKKPTRSQGTLCPRPLTTNQGVQTLAAPTVKTREIGTMSKKGDTNSVGIQTAKLVVDSGTGDGDVNEPKVPTIKCEVETRTIGVGASPPEMTHSLSSSTSSLGGIRVCDKCSEQIVSTANVLVSRKDSMSRIPRPNSTKSQHIPSLSSNSSPVKAKQTTNACDSNMTTGNSEPSDSDSADSQTAPDTPRVKTEPTKEMTSACKVLNDCLLHKKSYKKSSSLDLIKSEWFKVASLKESSPYTVEDYLDFLESLSLALLKAVVNIQDNNGNTAIHYATSFGNFDVVSILLDSKVCDVNIQNLAGYTCIMLVSLVQLKKPQHAHIVQRLINLGDVNIKATQNGQTALMLAASQGHQQTVQMLLDAGAEPNIQDEDGSTALMCAAEHGHVDVIRSLLTNHDCDTELTDNDGSNALAIAVAAGHKDIGLMIYATSNFSRGSSPYSSQSRSRRRSNLSTPPPATPPRQRPMRRSNTSFY